MFNIEYYVRFYVKSDQFFIQIFCHLSPFTVPVYSRRFSDTIRLNRNEFLFIYKEIIPYFTDKQIVMSKDDLRLLYTTFTELNIPLPEVSKVKVSEVDGLIDWEGLSDLTPKEMLMLNLINGQRFASYIRHELYEAYQIDPNYYIKRLEEAGYIDTKDIAYSLERLPYKEWVALLEEFHMTSGNKDRGRIIQELVRKIDHERLVESIGDPYVKLTLKGEKIVQHTKHLLEFHNHVFRMEHQLSVDEFYVLSLEKPTYSPADVMRLLIVHDNSDELDRFDWRSVFHPKETSSESKGFVSSQFDHIIRKYSGEDEADPHQDQAISDQPTRFEFQTNEAFFEILSRTNRRSSTIDTNDSTDTGEDDVDEWDAFTRILQKSQINTEQSASEPKAKQKQTANIHTRTESDYLERMVDKPDLKLDAEPYRSGYIKPRVFLFNFFWSSILSILLLYIWFVLIF